MKNFLNALFAFALISILHVSSICQTAKPILNDLAWLAGCWEFNNSEKGLSITEQWMRPGGGLMIGAGRTVKGGTAVDYEFLRIADEAEGIFYIAKPRANKEETKFKLVRSTPGEAVFENPTHDFPQRIIYKLNGDHLKARIEGTANGSVRGMDFPYVRAKCS